MAETQSTCSLPDCSGAKFARGWCSRHYARWRKTGDPLGILRRSQRNDPCAVTECDRLAEKRGWCNMHYRRWLRTGDVTGTTRYSDSSEKIKALTRSEGDCLVWTGKLNPAGYARTRIDGRHTMVHRYMWEQANGKKAPADMDIDHICRRKNCVNPEHLRLATHKENMENRPLLNARSMSGVRGVSWDPSAGKWLARVTHDHVIYRLGWFRTVEEAAALAHKKRLELFTHNETDRAA